MDELGFKFRRGISPSEIAYSGSGAHLDSYLIGTGVRLRIEAGGTSILPVTYI
jgi:hypothetical protein